jgi:hypothetical protein
LQQQQQQQQQHTPCFEDNFQLLSTMTPKNNSPTTTSSTTKVAMGNEAFLLIADIFLAHQDLLAMFPAMDSALKEKDIKKSCMQWKTISATIKHATGNFEKALKLEGLLAETQKHLSTVRAETNHKIKMQKAISTSNNVMDPHQFRLDEFISNSQSQHALLKPPSKRQKPNLPTLEGSIRDLFAKHPPKEDTRVYSIKELVQYLFDNNIKLPILGKSPKSVFRLLEKETKYSVACSYNTLNRKVNNYKKNGILPALGDFGTREGRPCFVTNTQVPQLVAGLSESGGHVQTQDQFLSAFTSIQDKNRTDCGLLVSLQQITPCPRTIKKYKRKAAMLEGVTASEFTSVRGQTWQREVATNSFRNVLAQAAVTIAHHFVGGQWQRPTDLPRGAVEAHKYAETAFGCDMKPKDP